TFSPGPLGRCRRQPSDHSLGLVGLDDVPDFHVGVVLEADPALVPRGHLACVFLEAPQAADATIVDHDVVAHQPTPGAARDLPVDYIGSGDRADAADGE